LSLGIAAISFEEPIFMSLTISVPVEGLLLNLILDNTANISDAVSFLVIIGRFE
jgi:hypothetical protein